MAGGAAAVKTEVIGSNPMSPTVFLKCNFGPVVQLVRTPHLQCGAQRFESARVHIKKNETLFRFKINCNFFCQGL